MIGHTDRGKNVYNLPRGGGVSHGSVKTCILAPFLRVLRALLPGSTPTATRYALTGERGVRAAPPRDPPPSSPAALFSFPRAPPRAPAPPLPPAKRTRPRQPAGGRDLLPRRREVGLGGADAPP